MLLNSTKNSPAAWVGPSHVSGLTQALSRALQSTLDCPWVDYQCCALPVQSAEPRPAPCLTPHSGQALGAKAWERWRCWLHFQGAHHRPHCQGAAQHCLRVLPLGCSDASAGSCGLWMGGLGFVLAWDVGALQPPALLTFFCVYACFIVSQTNLNMLI